MFHNPARSGTITANRDYVRGNDQIVRKARNSVLRCAELCIEYGGARFEQQSVQYSYKLTLFDIIQYLVSQSTYNVILRCVRVTVVVAEQQEAILNLSVYF